MALTEEEFKERLNQIWRLCRDMSEDQLVTVMESIGDLEAGDD